MIIPVLKSFYRKYGFKIFINNPKSACILLKDELILFKDITLYSIKDFFNNFNARFNNTLIYISNNFTKNNIKNSLKKNIIKLLKWIFFNYIFTESNKLKILAAHKKAMKTKNPILRKFCMKNIHNSLLRPAYSIPGFLKRYISKKLKKSIVIQYIYTKLKKIYILFKKVYFLKKLKSLKKFLNIKKIFKFKKINIKKFFIKLKIKLKNIYVIVLLLLFYILCYYTLFYELNFNVYSRPFYKIYLLLLIFYIYNTFIHLSKYYFFNKYTSVIQRFWKRSYSIFWSLEITLFLIYIYLMLISPAEYNYYSYNHKEFNNNLLNTYNSYYLSVYIYSVYILTCVFLYMFYLKKKKKNNQIIISFIILIFLYMYVIYFEFYKYYFINNWYSLNKNEVQIKNSFNILNYNNVDISINNNSLFFKNKSNNTVWSKTFDHFLSIIIILKFWHLMYIITFFYFLVLKYLNTRKIHFDTIGANYQNSLFVFFFYLISYVIFLKKNLYYLITFLYNSCVTTVNYSNMSVYYYYELYMSFINPIINFFII